jgi:hypothetical protein
VCSKKDKYLQRKPYGFTIYFRQVPETVHIGVRKMKLLKGMRGQNMSGKLLLLLILTPLHAFGPPVKFAADVAQSATLRLKLASSEAAEVAANEDEYCFDEDADTDGALVLHRSLPSSRVRAFSLKSKLLLLLLLVLVLWLSTLQCTAAAVAMYSGEPAATACRSAFAPCKTSTSPAHVRSHAVTAVTSAAEVAAVPPVLKVSESLVMNAFSPPASKLPLQSRTPSSLSELLSEVLSELVSLSTFSPLLERPFLNLRAAFQAEEKLSDSLKPLLKLG